MRLEPFVLLAAAALATGCSQSATTAPAAPEAHATADVHEGHSHEGWWCNEHGVPEEVCAICDSKLVNEFKQKGDWCKEHERPDSQCFVCHPEFAARYAAQYEAKYGKKPPKPEG